MPFATILGQDRPRQIIQKAIINNSLSHAYLFYGPASVGKRRTAFELAKALNCLESGPEDGCGACSSCRKIDSGTHPDCFLLEPVKSSPTSREAVIKIEAVRELQKKLSFLPYEGKTKVAVIDGAEAMNPQAANTFLKTLEEPPAQTVLILIAANPFLLLPTLVSRCQGVKFDPLAPETVETILEQVLDPEERENMGPEEFKLRAARSMGGIRRALDADIQKTEAVRRELVELLSALSFERMDLAFKWSRDQAKQPGEVQAVLDEMLNLLRDLAVLKTPGPEERIFNRDIAETLKPLARRKHRRALFSLFDTVLDTQAALKGNANTLLTLENMLIRFCEAA